MAEKVNSIHRFKALMIIFIFSFSLLPRQVLHNIVTNHQHVKYSDYAGKNQLVSGALNCNTNSIFVLQVFADTPSYNGIKAAPQLPVVFACENYAAVYKTLPATQLRGPPAIS